MTRANVNIRVLISKSAELDVLTRRLISIPKTHQSIFRYEMFPKNVTRPVGLRERDILQGCSVIAQRYTFKKISGFMCVTKVDL